MSPATKKARTIRFLETFKPAYRMQCVECLACCPPDLKFFTFHDWMSIHSDFYHRTPQTLRRAPPRRKILPMMAKRTTAEEYRKLRKQARRRRQFKGIKDKGQGAMLKWF